MQYTSIYFVQKISKIKWFRIGVKGINKNILGRWKNSKNHKEAGVVILISDKVEFKSKSLKQDREVCFLMVKATIHNENITCMSIYAPCNTAVTLSSQNYQ